MKKILSLLLIVLMMFTVLFVSVSCAEEPSEPAKTGYVVKYDTQGGSTVDAVSVEPGAVSEAPKKDPTKTDYVFLGWFDDADGKVAHDFTAAVNSDITIYAKWQDKWSYEHTGTAILPAGTKAVVPSDWSTDANGWTAANGHTDLPAFVTNGSKTNVTEELKAALAAVDQSFFATTPKNVIVIISDGMGVSHLQMSREYKGELVMDLLPYSTYSLTDSYLKAKEATDSNRLSKTTTDSCAGGTQILTGYKTRYAYISSDIDGNPVKNLSELAKENGWKVGVTTNDWVTDATPADTYGHATAREVGDLLGFQAIYVNTPDLLMGGGSFSTYFKKGDGVTWSSRLLDAEKDAMDDCLSKEFSGTEKSTLAASLASASSPIAWYKTLTAAQKSAVERYSVYYYIWKTYTNQAVAYTTWAESKTGLEKFCSDLDTAYGNPSDKITTKTFKQLCTNTDFSKPLFNLWSSVGGNDYDSSKPGRGYLLKSNSIPNFTEMVAYTIYQLDKMADEADTGFFCMIENTCTDGWGHSENKSIKREGTMNEVQCTDEGVAIAVKYVLEHPDTLLIVTADHETGGYVCQGDWKTDFSKIKSTTTGHSSQVVPCIAFGAGADRFSAEAIAAAYPSDSSMNTTHTYEDKDVLQHEGWITGQIIGQLMGDANFGQPVNYPN